MIAILSRWSCEFENAWRSWGLLTQFSETVPNGEVELGAYSPGQRVQEPD